MEAACVAVDRASTVSKSKYVPVNRYCSQRLLEAAWMPAAPGRWEGRRAYRLIRIALLSSGTVVPQSFEPLILQ